MATASTAKSMARPCRWVVDPGQRSGEHFELDAAGLQGRRQSHQSCGVAGRVLEIVDGGMTGWFRGGLLDVVGEGEGTVELGPDLDPAADLLGDDPLAPCALQGVDLDLQVLLDGGAADVPIRIGAPGDPPDWSRQQRDHRPLWMRWA